MPNQAQGRGSIPVLKPGATITVAMTTSPATSAILPGSVVRVYASDACFYKVGTGATVTDVPLSAGTPEYIRIDYADTISAVLAAGTGTLYITVME